MPRSTRLLSASWAPASTASRKPPDKPCRLHGAVVRVEEGAAEQAVERRRELLQPVGIEAVVAQEPQLALELRPLRLVDGEAEAAGAAKLIAGEPRHGVEGTLRERPQKPSAFRAERRVSRGVAHRSAAKREAAVAAACAASHLASLVYPNTQPAPGQAQGARASGHSRADHDDVDRAGRDVRPEWIARLGEPI